MSIEPIITGDGEPGPRGQYRKTAETRERLLDAAVEVFGEAGYESGSLRQVAERAGMSQAGLLHHFPSKVALLSAVLERRDQRSSAEEGMRGPGIARLAAMVANARASTSLPWEIDLFAVLSAEATRVDHPANDYMRRRYQWVLATATEAFTAARDAGHLLEWVDPEVAASQLVALWDGLQIQWLLQVAGVDMAKQLERFINLHLTQPLAALLDHAEATRIH